MPRKTAKTLEKEAGGKEASMRPRPDAAENFHFAAADVAGANSLQ